jgi:HK97 family phage major capsid protein
VPSGVRSIAAINGSGAYWTGEGQPRPMSRMTFDGETLTPLSVSAILVTTAELLRSSAPSAESVLSRDLAGAAVQAMDEAFIDPANGGIANVKPAAITHGVGAFVSTGSSLAQIDADLAGMIDALSEAGSDLQFASFVMAPRSALYLARLRGTGGALAHPGMTAKGGTLLGLPAITSAAVPHSGSPATSTITLLDAAQVLVADEGAAALELSERGALQMESAPGSGAQNLVSLWQTNAAALKTTRYANWRKCRPNVARVLTGVSY